MVYDCGRATRYHREIGICHTQMGTEDVGEVAGAAAGRVEVANDAEACVIPVHYDQDRPKQTPRTLLLQGVHLLKTCFHAWNVMLAEDAMVRTSAAEGLVGGWCLPLGSFLLRPQPQARELLHANVRPAI